MIPLHAFGCSVLLDVVGPTIVSAMIFVGFSTMPLQPSLGTDFTYPKHTAGHDNFPIRTAFVV